MSLALKENNVHRGYRYLSTLFLTAALAAPVAMMARAFQLDDKNHEEKQAEEQQALLRYGWP